MASSKQNLAPCEYKTGRTLGQGAYATVKEAVKIGSGEKLAVKVISKGLMQGREHMILNEIDVLKRISAGHPNIVTLHDYFETPNNLYLVMDLCTGGELFDRLCDNGSFYETDAAKIVSVILDATAYLHNLNVVHRDIKPENLLFKSKDPGSELLIADFGLSKIMDPEKYDVLMTTCGTPGYMAPEVIRKIGHGKPVDLWSIGVLTYFLLCGYTPFDSHNNVDELNRIMVADFTFDPEYWSEISDSAKNFIKSLIVVDPAARPTALQALQHQWIFSNTHTNVNLMPNVRERFSARTAWRKGIDAVKENNRKSGMKGQGVYPLDEDVKNVYSK